MTKNWTITENKLTRDIQLGNFNDCMSLVNDIAKVADEMNHHPDILIHSFNRLRISIYTHSENRITESDHQLAEKIEKLMGR